MSEDYERGLAQFRQMVGDERVDALVERDVEARHRSIGDRQDARAASRDEEGDDRTAAAHDVAITYYRKLYVMPPFIIIGSNEKFVRS